MHSVSGRRRPGFDCGKRPGRVSEHSLIGARSEVPIEGTGWMSRHRVDGEQTTARRGMASWPIVVIGLIIVCLLGWVGWTWLHSAMETRAAERAKACSRGDLAMRIAVTPAVEQAVSE